MMGIAAGYQRLCQEADPLLQHKKDSAAKSWCARRRQRARLARLTRAAATRNPRGITPEAHRDHFFAAPAAQKNPTASRVSSRNSVVRLHKSQQTGPQKHPIMRRYCLGMSV
jgi:hypothetical protein